MTYLWPSTRARRRRGRSSSTASGEIVAVAQREFHQHFPQPGWVEHDAEEIWSSQRDVACEALATAKAQSGRRRGASASRTSARRSSFGIVRRASRSIARSCGRIAARRPRCDGLRTDGREPMVHEKTGLLLDPYFSATKIAWILDHVDGARAAAEAGKLACGTIDSWLIYRLTAARCT